MNMGILVSEWVLQWGREIWFYCECSVVGLWVEHDEGDNRIWGLFTYMKHCPTPSPPHTVEW